MEYSIYKKINNTNVRTFIGYCFIKNPDTEMSMEQVKKKLKHFGQKLLPGAGVSSAKYVYVEDDDKEFEFIPML